MWIGDYVRGKKGQEIKVGSEEDQVRAVEERSDVKLGVVERDDILGLVSQIK